MKRSTDRIITTHSGSLSRPVDLIALNRSRTSDQTVEPTAYASCLSSAVAAVVKKQDEVLKRLPAEGRCQRRRLPRRARATVRAQRAKRGI